MNDVAPDGKVKIFVRKDSQNAFNQAPQTIAHTNSVVSSVSSASNVSNSPQNNSSSTQQQNPNEISSSTSVLDTKILLIPSIESTDKIVLKIICPQIRKSPM